jgi:AcrR family transcriptional regulator
MPQLIDSHSRVEALVAAVNELLVTEGIPGVTLRKVASVSRVSTGSIIHHLGGKARLLSLGAGITAKELRLEIERRRWADGVLAFLPHDDDGVVKTRAWLAWLELGRSDLVVELPVSRGRLEERGLLAETLDHRLSRDDLDLLHALIDGLRAAVCLPTRPMPPTRARELLAQHLRRVGVPIRPGEAGP